MGMSRAYLPSRLAGGRPNADIRVIGVSGIAELFAMLFP